MMYNKIIVYSQYIERNMIIMRILYIVNMDENNRKGLFMATHEKIKEIMKCHPENEYEIISVQFCDKGIFRFLKKLTGKKTYDRTSDKFIYDGVKYRKVYLSIDLKSKEIEKKDDDQSRFKEFFEQCSDSIEKCDMISCHWGYPHGRIAYWANKIYKKPYIVTYHGSDVHTMPFADESIRKKVLEVMNNAVQNIFVSRKLMETARELGHTKDNCTASRNGVNAEKFGIISEDKIKEIKEKYKISGKVVGFAGAVNQVKRADRIDVIFESIKKQDPNTEYTYLVVGDGPLKSSLESRCKEKNLNVVFTGNQDTDGVRDFMNVMDVMIIPSRREGFGCVVTEANACGASVVGSDAGGIPEAIGIEDNVINDGENFEKRMAKRIIDVIHSEINRKELSDFTINNFSWEKIAEIEYKFYMEGEK